MRRIAFKTPEPAVDLSPLSPKETFLPPADRLSHSPQGAGQLPIDILENEREILILTPIAGVDLDKTEIVITNDVLTIRGERQTDLSQFDFQKRDYYVQECFWGRFSRSVILPAQADTARVEAIQKDHVLYLRIPKKSAIQMRIVKIRS